MPDDKVVLECSFLALPSSSVDIIWLLDRASPADQKQHLQQHRQASAQSVLKWTSKYNRPEVQATSVRANDEELASDTIRYHLSSATVLYDSRDHRLAEGDTGEGQLEWPGGQERRAGSSKSGLSSNKFTDSDEFSEYQSLDSRMLIRDSRPVAAAASAAPKLARWPLVKQTQLIIQATHLDDTAR